MARSRVVLRVTGQMTARRCYGDVVLGLRGGKGPWRRGRLLLPGVVGSVVLLVGGAPALAYTASPDVTFGTGGVSTIPGLVPQAMSVWRAKTYVLGRVQGHGSLYRLDRLLADGAVDPGFHVTRRIRNPGAAMVSQPNGKVLLLWTAPHGVLTVARYGVHGRLDSDYGHRGAAAVAQFGVVGQATVDTGTDWSSRTRMCCPRTRSGTAWSVLHGYFHPGTWTRPSARTAAAASTSPDAAASCNSPVRCLSTPATGRS